VAEGRRKEKDEKGERRGRKESGKKKKEVSASPLINNMLMANYERTN